MEKRDTYQNSMGGAGGAAEDELALVANSAAGFHAPFFADHTQDSNSKSRTS